MKLGIIAGNRFFPVYLIKQIRRKYPQAEISAICFYKETSSKAAKLADKAYWVRVGKLTDLISAIKESGSKEWIMAGQISPYRIFRERTADKPMQEFLSQIKDFRPHHIFSSFISYLEKEGVTFLDSTSYIKESLAVEGRMNEVPIDKEKREDINFGIDIGRRFVDLDIGQTLVVKNRTVAALEAIEGTDNTIRRACKIAKAGCTVLKLSKHNQDLRFDVPVVGLNTLRLLWKYKVSALVLEAERVIILQKDKFLDLAQRANISVEGVKIR